jgi:tetratricopeptide (TPR) repeat protein
LGVVYCRDAKATQADAAFAKARELISVLADDYPEETIYRSSLAALLNNQALALFDAHRYQEAVNAYQDAIAMEIQCRHRFPDSPALREALSKMYYNCARAKMALGDHEKALQLALTRRDLWTHSSDRLLGVAAELSEMSTAIRGTPQGTTKLVLLKQIDDEVFAILSQACEVGLPDSVHLAQDKRFAHYSSDKRFKALFAEQTDTSNSTSQPSQTNHNVTSPRN